MTLEEEKRFYVFAALIMWAILPIREWRCQDIGQVLLHKILFFLSVFSSSEMSSKNASIRSKLLTATYWSWEDWKRGRCEANLLYGAQSKSTPVELSFQSYCSVDFDSLALMPFDMTFSRRCLSAEVLINLQIHVIKTSHFPCCW